MTAAPQSDFSEYLASIKAHYKEWWKIDALTHQIADRQATFTFEQQVQTEEKPTGKAESQQGRNSQTIQLPLISGIQTYAKAGPVLVVGSPGVGKTSALLRCLLEYAKQELLKPEHEQRIPVLIRLKKYDDKCVSADDRSGLLGMIQDALDPELCLELAEIKKLLFQEKRLILLLDGLNEMSSNAVRTGLISFREKCVRARVPLICSTRELGSGDLGITRKLIIQPPVPQEIDRFLDECIPAESRRKVEDLLNQDRRELSRTPFVLWMLYHVVQETGNVAVTLGGAFRQFFQSFKCRLEAAPVPENRRQEWDAWLKHLAFAMFSSPDPLDPGLTISEADANTVLLQAFPTLPEPPSLSELLKYHLLQQENNKISFQHQLVQEYYAAEALVDRLESKLEAKKIPDDEFKHYYLNYLRWTEPIALMLSLLEEKNDKEALQIVQWALDIDLMLGARLAGAVRSGLQERSVGWVNRKEIPSVLKIRLLGATKSDYAIESLLAFLINEVDQDLIIGSAFALREINSIKIIAELQNALESDDEIVVIAAIFILKGLGNEAAPYLKVALNHPNEKVREQAVEGLGTLNDRALVPELLKILRDKNESEQVRNKAIEVLGELGDERAFSDLLEAALENRSELLSGIAAKALGKVNQEKAIGALIDALNHKDIKIRRNAAGSLGQIGNPAAIDRLISALETDVRPQATQALINLGSKAAIPKLLELLLHPNLSVQECAIFVLRELGDQAAVPGLLHTLKYGCPSTREITIETLGVIGDETVIPKLKPFLNDPSSVVRENALIALGLLGDESVRPELLSLLQKLSVSYTRRFHQLFKALEKVANSEVLDGLLNALKAQNYRLRLHVVNLLEKVGNEHIIPELIESLRDEHPSVRFYTQQAIGRFGNQTVLPQLYQLLTSPEIELRKAAIGAIKVLGDNDDSIRELIKQLEGQDLSVCMSAVDALGDMKNIQALPHLWSIYCQGKVECLSAIEAIQSDCKFYNYEVYERSQAMREQAKQKTEGLLQDQLNHIKEKLETMTDGSKYNFPNAQKVQIIEKLENYHEHNYAAQPDKSQAVAEIHQLLESLEHQYPTVTEAEAKNIIEAEIVSIQTHEPQRWQMLRKELLNRERWFNGGKAALVEATQTLADKLWLNVLVAFLDGFSADV